MAAAPDDAPLVSCVVPTFNAERFLGETLSSILAQSHRPIEVIVSDDGSSDRTLAIASSAGPLVRTIEQHELGPAATRNAGLRASSGEYVAFLDPDDLWHPHKLERQLAHFSRVRSLDVSVTHARLFWPDEMAEERVRLVGERRADAVPGYAFTTVLARRTVFDLVGELDTGRWFTDSTDWFLRAREAGCCVELIDDVLTFHRMHPANLTRRRAEASRAEFLGLVKRTLDRRRTSG